MHPLKISSIGMSDFALHCLGTFTYIVICIYEIRYKVLSKQVKLLKTYATYDLNGSIDSFVTQCHVLLNLCPLSFALSSTRGFGSSTQH
jgi:hypothetical protein